MPMTANITPKPRAPVDAEKLLHRVTGRFELADADGVGMAAVVGADR